MKRILLVIVLGLLCGLAGTALFILSIIWHLNYFNQSESILYLLSASTIFVSLLLISIQLGLREHRKLLRLDQEKIGTEIKLQEEHDRFKTIFNLSDLGIAILSVEGNMLSVNSAFTELFNYKQAELLGMNFYNLIHDHDLNELEMHIQQLMDMQITTYQSEQQCYRKGGDKIWMMMTLSLIHNNENLPIYFVLQLQDITIQKCTEEKLKHMAYHDPLTGLANRNKLEQFISHMLAQAQRHQNSFALLFLDLDRFKNINDTIGHESGDLLLQIVSERLLKTVRKTDIVARLGGDEFVLLLTDIKKIESVAIIAEKILGNILRMIVIKGQEIYITTSIGISLYPDDGENMQSLMKNADLALYRAKEHGRNNYQFYTIEMTTKAKEKLALQNALGDAIVKSEFDLHYQPEIEIKTQTITGVEAFLRWQNNQYPHITPDEIINLAEETGLIIPVSDWVLKTALRQLKVWYDMGMKNLSMAINSSKRQFKQATFIDDILQTLKELSLPPCLLEIEIKESMIMEDQENMLQILYNLKDLGIKIVIDDFGTGYWSINNLRRLFVDKIKIDQTFIKQISNDEISRTMVSAMIAMINKLGIVSVAEGVETEKQYQFLLAEGCTEMQGYYLTKPLSERDITRFLKDPPSFADKISEDEKIY